MFAGIGKLNIRDSAVAAQVGRPFEVVVFEQAAFFLIAPTKVIAIEKSAVFASRSAHARDYSMGIFWTN